MAALTTFTCFPMLPIEVRLLIWEAVDTPYDQSQIHSIRGFPLHVLKVNHPEVNVLERDVTFTAEREWFQQGLSSFHCTFGVIFMSTTAAPIHPVLHACSESRMHIIKKRGLEYAFHTYVRPEHDIFFLDRSRTIVEWDRGFESAWKLIKDLDLASRIRKIAISVHFDHGPMAIANVAKRRLPSLKELYFVHPFDPLHLDHDRSSYVDERCRGRQVNFMLAEHLWMGMDMPWHIAKFENDWSNAEPARDCNGEVIPGPKFFHRRLEFILEDDKDEVLKILDEKLVRDDNDRRFWFYLGQLMDAWRARQSGSRNEEVENIEGGETVQSASNEE